MKLSRQVIDSDSQGMNFILLGLVGSDEIAKLLAESGDILIQGSKVSGNNGLHQMDQVLTVMIVGVVAWFGKQTKQIRFKLLMSRKRLEAAA